MTISTEKTDIAIAAMTKMMAETEKEAGNTGYSFTQDLENPGTFHIFEKWESEEALAAHLEEPHMKEFMEAMGGFEVAEAKIMKYEVASEKDFFG